MIVSIRQQYHDYEPKSFVIDSDKLNKDNPIDVMVLKALKKKGFSSDVFVNVREQRNLNPEFWEEPRLSADPNWIDANKAAVVKDKNIKPDKHINLEIFFDC